MQAIRVSSNPCRWATSTALVCLLLLVSASLVYAATQTWTQKTTAATPYARYGHAMADIGGNQALLFGGRDSYQYDDTWVYDLNANTWTNENPSIEPHARQDHAMAYIGNNQVLLFGGQDESGKRYNDTWVYDLGTNTWTLKSPPTSPPARSLLAMAYLGGDQVFLFGGQSDSSLYMNDTWVYDLSANTWTNKNPAIKPSVRNRHAMAYIGDDQALLFGGWNGTDRLYDTWVYDLSANTWTQKLIADPPGSPSSRYYHAMSYIGGTQVLLFGGYDGVPVNETQVYDLSANTWTQKHPTTSPSARYSHAMAYLGNEWVLLFGGQVPGTVYGDTWIAGGMGPTAVTLSSFRASAPTFDLGAWFAEILRRWWR